MLPPALISRDWQGRGKSNNNLLVCEDQKDSKIIFPFHPGFLFLWFFDIDFWNLVLIFMNWTNHKLPFNKFQSKRGQIFTETVRRRPLYRSMRRTSKNILGFDKYLWVLGLGGDRIVRVTIIASINRIIRLL